MSTTAPPTGLSALLTARQRWQDGGWAEAARAADARLRAAVTDEEIDAALRERQALGWAFYEGGE